MITNLRKFFVGEIQQKNSQGDVFSHIEQSIGNILSQNGYIGRHDLELFIREVQEFPEDFLPKEYYIKVLSRSLYLYDPEKVATDFLDNFFKKYSLVMGIDYFIVPMQHRLIISIPRYPKLMKQVNKLGKLLSDEIFENQEGIKKHLIGLLGKIDAYKNKRKIALESKKDIEKCPSNIIVTHNNKISDVLYGRAISIHSQVTRFDHNASARKKVFDELRKIEELSGDEVVDSETYLKIANVIAQCRTILSEQKGKIQENKVTENASDTGIAPQESSSKITKLTDLVILPQNQEAIEFLQKKEPFLDYHISSKKLKGSIGDGTFVRTVWKLLIARSLYLFSHNLIDAHDFSWERLALALEKNIEGANIEIRFSMFLTVLKTQKDTSSFMEGWKNLRYCIDEYAKLNIFSGEKSGQPLKNLKEKYSLIFGE